MITIEIKMPASCYKCPFLENETGSCLASEDTEEQFFALDQMSMQEKWKCENPKDYRCPLKEAVRCKDCQYGIVHENEVECTAHQEQGYDPEPYHPLDWFCADGKKAEKGGIKQ